MRISLLAIANGIVAVALACFVYVMLPYANGVACDTPLHLGGACKPIGNVSLLLQSFAPVAIIGTIIFSALRMQQRHPRVATSLLLFCPAAIATWALIVWGTS